MGFPGEHPVHTLYTLRSGAIESCKARVLYRIQDINTGFHWSSSTLQYNHYVPSRLWKWYPRRNATSLLNCENIVFVVRLIDAWGNGAFPISRCPGDELYRETSTFKAFYTNRSTLGSLPCSWKWPLLPWGTCSVSGIWHSRCWNEIHQSTVSNFRFRGSKEPPDSTKFEWAVRSLLEKA